MVLNVISKAGLKYLCDVNLKSIHGFKMLLNDSICFPLMGP